MSQSDNQFSIWKQEHITGDFLPSETADTALESSSGVVDFFAWLKERGVMHGRVLDIGCGKGRNALYAASLGFDVTAMDFVAEAIAGCAAQAASQGLDAMLKTTQHRMDEAWPFDDMSFDIVIDSFATIDIDTAAGRAIAIKEMHRTLAPGGYAFIQVVAADDEYEAEQIAKRPGAEMNSCFWPNGKFQKDYTEEELREVYADFTITQLEKRSKPAVKMNRTYTATNYWMILQK